MKVSQRAESNRASGFISPGDNRMPPYKSPAIKPAAGRGEKKGEKNYVELCFSRSAIRF